MFYRSLIVFILFAQIIPQLLFLFRVIAVVSRKYGNLSVIDLDHFFCNPVEEVAVVGNDQNAALIVREIILQPFD